MSRNVVNGINLDTLRQCREQIGLSVEDVKKKVARIDKFESGAAKPTFKQIADLSELYLVPQWVFLSAELPEEYKLDSNPAFRTLARTSQFAHYSIRKLLTKVERFRELIIDFRNDQNEPVPNFQPPRVEEVSNMAEVANIVREWLGCSGYDRYDFNEWREIIESKDVFVFLTSKLSSWSKVEVDLFRGMAIYKEILPIIIINDSDTYKAQIFTLFHELGHLLKKQIALDNTDFEDESKEEVWCNDFAGNFLMPYSKFRHLAPPSAKPDKAIGEIKNIAKDFAVSPLACLVRMRKLGMVDKMHYEEIKSLLDIEYSRYKENQRDSIFGGRDMEKEVIRQYGNLYISVVVDAYHSREISLHRLCKLLDLKRPKSALEVANKL